MENSELLEKLPFWDKLSPVERNFVGQNALVRSYAKGALLKGGGESCLGMIYVLRGSLRALMLSDEGREITLFRLYPGDSGILSASCVLAQVSFDTEMIATEASQILVVNSGAYSKLMEDNIEVRCFSYQLATERSSNVIWVLQQILFAKFDKRLARFLLSESEKRGNAEIIMTKEAIAQEVNTAREVVSRMLRRFSDEGLIKMNQKAITVLDSGGLRKIVK